MNFAVNTEILRLTASFTFEVTYLGTNRYSYGNISLNSAGKSSPTKVYLFDFKNKVKFEFMFSFSQN